MGAVAAGILITAAKAGVPTSPVTIPWRRRRRSGPLPEAGSGLPHHLAARTNRCALDTLVCIYINTQYLLLNVSNVPQNTHYIILEALRVHIRKYFAMLDVSVCTQKNPRSAHQNFCAQYVPCTQECTVLHIKRSKFQTNFFSTLVHQKHKRTQNIL